MVTFNKIKEKSKNETDIKNNKTIYFNFLTNSYFQNYILLKKKN